MASSQPSVVAHARPSAGTHLRLAEDICPTCEQPIPHERAEEIARRLESREREKAAELTGRLQQQFATDKALALKQAEREAAERIAAAREEAREATEAEAEERIEQAERARADVEAALTAKIEEATTEKSAAVAAQQALNDELEEMRRDAASKEKEIRAEALRAAEERAQSKIADLERERQESEGALKELISKAEADKIAAEGATNALEEKLAAANLEAELAAEEARVEAEATLATVQGQVRTLQETHQSDLAERLREQREALESAQTLAVNAEKSAAFEEKLKWSAKVDDLQRALDKKTAEELGEGAEIDLYEALKEEFGADRIERVNKGQPGADIFHTVFHNGRECGTIIYDSKNHSAWRSGFVTKLQADQMAAKAAHAILSTRKFPAGARHLHVQDGVILASPSRVVALVQIIRQHLVSTHTLRISNEARTQKTAELYDFITSDRCRDLFERFDTHTDDLLELQVKEKKAHDATWKRQGELLRTVQRVRAELCNEIETIIGTSQSAMSAQ